MTILTKEKLEKKDGQNDYAQALEEGEITRILKTVQAARFQKSETLIATEDKVFKPRSLVEIAFAAEQKQEQKRAEKSETTMESAHNEALPKPKVVAPAWTRKNVLAMKLTLSSLMGL